MATDLVAGKFIFSCSTERLVADGFLAIYFEEICSYTHVASMCMVLLHRVVKTEHQTTPKNTNGKLWLRDRFLVSCFER